MREFDDYNLLLQDNQLKISEESKTKKIQLCIRTMPKAVSWPYKILKRFSIIHFWPEKSTKIQN